MNRFCECHRREGNTIILRSFTASSSYVFVIALIVAKLSVPLSAMEKTHYVNIVVHYSTQILSSYPIAQYHIAPFCKGSNNATLAQNR